FWTDRFASGWRCDLRAGSSRIPLVAEAVRARTRHIRTHFSDQVHCGGRAVSHQSQSHVLLGASRSFWTGDFLRVLGAGGVWSSAGSVFPLVRSVVPGTRSTRPI